MGGWVLFLLRRGGEVRRVRGGGDERRVREGWDGRGRERMRLLGRK